MGYEEIRKLGQKGGSHLHALDIADLTILTTLMQPIKVGHKVQLASITAGELPDHTPKPLDSYLSYSFIPYRLMNR